MNFARFIDLPLLRRGAWVECLPENSRSLWFERSAEEYRVAAGRLRIILDRGDYRCGTAC